MHKIMIGIVLVATGSFRNGFAAHIQQDVNFKPVTTVCQVWIGTQLSKLKDNVWGHQRTVLEELQNVPAVANPREIRLLHRIDHAIDGYIQDGNSKGLQALVSRCNELGIVINNVVAQSARIYLAKVKETEIAEEIKAVQLYRHTMNLRYAQALQRMDALETSLAILVKLEQNGDKNAADAQGGVDRITSTYNEEKDRKFVTTVEVPVQTDMEEGNNK